MSSTDNINNTSSCEENVAPFKGQEITNMVFAKFGELARLLNVQDETKYEDDPLMEIGMYISLYFGQCVEDQNNKCSSAGLKAFLKHVLTEHDHDNLPDNNCTEQ